MFHETTRFAAAISLLWLNIQKRVIIWSVVARNSRSFWNCMCCMVPLIIINDVLSAISGVDSLVFKDYITVYYFVVEFKGASERSSQACWRLLL